MIKWALADRLFDGFSIMRWTEFFRPFDFYEIDKHALKASAVFVIGKEYEEKTGSTLNWVKIVDNIGFAYLNKVATSDMNSNVHSRIKEKRRENLNAFILQTYFYKDNNGEEPLLFEKNTITYDDYNKYLANSTSLFTVEDAILYFSHKFVTYREFKIIESLNQNSPETRRVNFELSNVLDDVIDKLPADFENKKCLKDIFSHFKTEDSNSYIVYRYFEQLRPQTRWAQTQRIPRTTVAGHVMFVALLTYFMTKELFGIPFEEYYKEDETRSDLGLAKKIVVNNFFAALFHDISEAFTRDVISPIKENIKSFDSLLNQIETGFIKEKILSKLSDENSIKQFKCLLGYGYNKNGELIEKGNEEDNMEMSEFSNRKDTNKKDSVVVFGSLIKIADKISSFMEAKKSIDLGISTPDLQHGLKATQNALNGRVYNKELNIYVQTKNNIYKNPNDPNQKLFINDFLATIPHYLIDDSYVIGGKR